MNLFNDNIDYSVNGVDDLNRLNMKVPEVAQKFVVIFALMYLFFRFTWLDPKKSPPVLAQYLSNMELLHTLVGKHDVVFYVPLIPRGYRVSFNGRRWWRYWRNSSGSSTGSDFFLFPPISLKVANRLRELQDKIDSRNAQYAFARRVDVTINPASLTGPLTTNDWRSFSKMSTGYSAMASVEVRSVALIVSRNYTEFQVLPRSLRSLW